MTDDSPAVRRSALMRKVRQRDTMPELRVRRMLHARGWRYRLHRKSLPGTPDIVFPGLRAVLFVNGCFWHGHICRLGRPPKTRREYWEPKIAANRERDARKIAQLLDAGWRAMTVWQCSLAYEARTIVEIEDFLSGSCLVSETSATPAREGN